MIKSQKLITYKTLDNDLKKILSIIILQYFSILHLSHKQFFLNKSDEKIKIDDDN